MPRADDGAEVPRAACPASPVASTYTGLVQRLDEGLWPGLPTSSRQPCRELVPSWLEGVTPWGDAVGFGIGPCGEIYPAHGATLLDDHERHYLSAALDAELGTLPLGPMVDPG